MENNTKKAIMLGILLLGCGLTSLLGSLLGKTGTAQLLSTPAVVAEPDRNAFLQRQGKENAKTIKIYVSGAVVHPGLYDLPKDKVVRAEAALSAAGGVLPTADLQRVNLAKKLKDGMQVNVPFLKQGRQTGRSQRNSSTRTEIQELDVPSRVNLNAASLEELVQLPGIGPGMAQKIVEYRERRGFASVDELLRIPGIGKAKLARLRERVYV